MKPCKHQFIVTVEGPKDVAKYYIGVGLQRAAMNFSIKPYKPTDPQAVWTPGVGWDIKPLKPGRKKRG